jgi:hypothetical protein
MEIMSNRYRENTAALRVHGSGVITLQRTSGSERRYDPAREAQGGSILFSKNESENELIFNAFIFSFLFGKSFSFSKRFAPSLLAGSPADRLPCPQKLYY